MRATCLASSSAGNCYIFDFEVDGIHTLLMVECGIPYSEILKRCNQNNVDLSKVNECLITHGHSDHCLAAKDLSHRGVKMFASKDTLDHIGINGVELEMESPKSINDYIKILPFEVEHDIDGSCGFVIKTKYETVIFVNDCKKWKCNLNNFKPDYVFIECNYNHEMVYAQLHSLEKENMGIGLDDDIRKENNIKIDQHKRNINSHMSLHGTIVSLHRLNLKNCKAIILMHMSDRYANEYLMKNKIRHEFGVPTYAAKKLGGIK